MESMMLGAIAWWKQALAVVFIIIGIGLIILVLLQKGRGGGLSAAFGGAGGQSAFGSKTGDVFTWTTVVFVAFFLLMAMILTSNYKPDNVDEFDAVRMAPQQVPPGGMAPAAPGQTTPPTGTTQQVPVQPEQSPDTPAAPKAP